MELTTRRLLLRPLQDHDARAIVLGAGNINVSRNLARVRFPYAMEDAEAFLSSRQNWDARNRVCAITFKAAPDELIGIISYEIYASGQFEFGYWLNESCWHMRIGSEAAMAMAVHAFEQDKVESLNSGYHTDNPNSGRILRGLGFVETGVAQEECLAQGRPVPCMRLALTAADWQAQKETRAA